MRIVAMIGGVALLSACGGAVSPAENGAAGNDSVTVLSAGPAASPTPAGASEAAVPLLNIAPGAIALVDPRSGSSRELAFGTAKEMVLAATIRALGAPRERGVNNECGEGAMDYATFPGGLSLWFQQDKLAGWFLDGGKGRIATASGVGIGSARAAVVDSYAVKEIEGSTLGREFSTEDGSLSGLLSGTGEDATVTALWSGQACLMR